ncbi:MAG: hypothetical protein U1F66_07500 [bacterium]
MTISPRAEKAFQLLTELNEIDVGQYQQILKDRLGPEILAVFESYCREIMPEEENDEVLGTLVHLMITGYLVSANEAKDVFGPKIEIAE